MTIHEANDRLRALCMEAMTIAVEQGWDWTIDAQPEGGPGWRFVVWTDTARQHARSGQQMPLVEEETP